MAEKKHNLSYIYSVFIVGFSLAVVAKRAEGIVKEVVTYEKKEKLKRTVNLAGLWISMFLSIGGMIGIYLDESGVVSLLLIYYMSIPGLTGLYFSTKIKSVKLRWLLLVINYLLATSCQCPSTF